MKEQIKELKEKWLLKHKGYATNERFNVPQRIIESFMADMDSLSSDLISKETVTEWIDDYLVKFKKSLKDWDLERENWYQNYETTFTKLKEHIDTLSTPEVKQ